jgi:hypothetical protein
VVSSVKKESVTPAARRAAVLRVARSYSKAVRISEGQRRAIVGDEAYRSGYAPAR